jgi:uncharacterized protein (DUF305 family)
MRMNLIAIILGVLVISSSQSAATDQNVQGTEQATPKGNMGNSMSTFMQQMHESTAQMHRAMTSVPMTGDPDRDFARMMIPHHQGAIAMAEAVLEKGHDPEIRDMAQNIIEKQQQEIKQLQSWLAGHEDSVEDQPHAKPHGG